jgi:hypothetical protein
LFGYDVGVLSGALRGISGDFGLTLEQEEALVSVLLAGALFGE